MASWETSLSVPCLEYLVEIRSTLLSNLEDMIVLGILAHDTQLQSLLNILPGQRISTFRRDNRIKFERSTRTCAGSVVRIWLEMKENLTGDVTM